MRLVSLTFPPAPFLSHAAGEEGGGCPSPSPRPPSSPTRGGEGGMNGTGAILRLSITPLPQRGRGAGGEGSPHRPPARGRKMLNSSGYPLLTLGRKMLKSAGRRSLLTCESGQIVLQ